MVIADKEEALAVLKQGMSTELWGLHFYQQAAKRAKAADGARVFESLIAEEEKHLDILRGEYAVVSGDKEWVTPAQARELAASVSPTTIFPQAAQAEQLIPEGATDERALEMAMDFERRGYNFYDAEAQKATSVEAKLMWRFLAQAEDGHYAFLQKTFEYLRVNGAWYFDEQEFPFFEA
jgi:rubrerythrin